MKIKQSLVGVGLGLALLLAACGGTNNPLGEASPPQPSESAASAPVVVGSADITESNIQAEIIQNYIRIRGIQAGKGEARGDRRRSVRAAVSQACFIGQIWSERVD